MMSMKASTLFLKFMTPEVTVFAPEARVYMYINKDSCDSCLPFAIKTVNISLHEFHIHMCTCIFRQNIENLIPVDFDSPEQESTLFTPNADNNSPDADNLACGKPIVLN